MYIDLITWKTFDYATPFSHDSHSQEFVPIASESNEHYVRTPDEPILKATPKIFESTQIHCKWSYYDHCSRC